MKIINLIIAVMFLAVAVSVPAQADLLQVSGKVTMLRVHDVGSGGYGPAADNIDVEVVIHVNSQPGEAYGFQLRNDDDRPARQGMLDLLRDAFNHNWTVTIDYYIESGKKNGVIIRTWLTK